jgi:hypothetical protein
MALLESIFTNNAQHDGHLSIVVEKTGAITTSGKFEKMVHFSMTILCGMADED